MSDSISWAKTFHLLGNSLTETALMVVVSTIIAGILGLMLGILIQSTSKEGIFPNKIIHQVLDTTVNILRSFPFIILMVIVFPLSRILVGTSIGPVAVIVPLTILAIPFVGRLIANSLSEVNKELISSAKVMGANNFDIIFKVILPESVPSLINDMVITIINIIGASAMAGSLGGGGIGDLAIRYGYQRFEPRVLFVSVVAIIIIVQIIQIVGDILVYSVRKKRGISKK